MKLLGFWEGGGGEMRELVQNFCKLKSVISGASAGPITSSITGSVLASRTPKSVKTPVTLSARFPVPFN
jgi:hypothetical protein